MPRVSLADFVEELRALGGEYLIFDDGYRSRARSYADVHRASLAFAHRLDDAGIRHGDRIIFWAENSPEWIAALLGAMVAGVVVVPVDYRSSRAFVVRVSSIVEARVWLTGDDTSPGSAASPGHGDAGGPPVWPMASLSWTADDPAPIVTIDPDDTAEIVFTSGATAEPKGVVLTHRNILANIEPIEDEIKKYRAFGRPFFPLRFLNLLPLSHMFGQSLAVFIPPLLPGTTVLIRGHHPQQIVDQIRRRRVTVLVAVPKMLDILRAYVQHAVPSAAHPAAPSRHWLWRWWMHRDVHRLFGVKFWCAVVGSAPLDPDLEAFWNRLGFLMIQGYGLTETAPVVTLNHPFSGRRGSVGAPLRGLAVRIASDGEILVRGDNVTRGYYRDPEATAAVLEDGWLRTGDIGDVDPAGRLYIRGRKKEVIVGPDGLNVFPDDIERVVNTIPGVVESAVVGVKAGTGEHVYAAVVLEAGVRTADVLVAVNARLEEHQRVQAVVGWPGGSLPRTEGTGKLKRLEVRQWALGELPAAPPGRDDDVVGSVVSRFAHGRVLPDSAAIEDIGLRSLDRVELMMALEHELETRIDESAFSSARTLRDLRAVAAAAPPPSGEGSAGMAYPSWNRSWPARVVRRAIQAVGVLPLTRLAASLTVEGREHLDGLAGPVVFAANHQSHLDTPCILAALPATWRQRIAPAMAVEFFAPHFFPAGHPWYRCLASSAIYYLAALCFGAFPLPQRAPGARETLRYMGELASSGYCVLIFPEGMRMGQGAIGHFKPGVAMIASRLRLPVVPVRLDGAGEVLPPGGRRPRRGPVRVCFGTPLTLVGNDYVALTHEVEEAIGRMGDDRRKSGSAE